MEIKDFIFGLLLGIAICFLILMIIVGLYNPIAICQKPFGVNIC